MTPRAEQPREEFAFNDRSAALNEARRRIANLETALQTNRRIGVAIGIVMSRHGVSEDEAFAMLAKASQVSSRKLRDVADEVAYQGDLPHVFQQDAQSAEDDSDADLGAVG